MRSDRVDGRDEPGHDGEGGAHRRPDGYPAAFAPGLGVIDFDKRLPDFNEFYSCAICIAVCPFSRPGVGVNLVEKLAERRARRG